MTGSSSQQRAGHSTKSSRPAVGVNRWLWVTLVVLIVAVAIVFGLRVYTLNSYKIPSVSLQAGLQVGDRVESDPQAYDTAAPQRGGVVVVGGAGSFSHYESVSSFKRIRDSDLSVLAIRQDQHVVV